MKVLRRAPFTLGAVPSCAIFEGHGNRRAFAEHRAPTASNAWLWKDDSTVQTRAPRSACPSTITVPSLG